MCGEGSPLGVKGWGESPKLPLSLPGSSFCIHHHIRILKVSHGSSPHFIDEQTEAKSRWNSPVDPQCGREGAGWDRNGRGRLGP